MSKPLSDRLNFARQTDLPNLLSSLGYQVKPKGNYNTLAEMPHTHNRVVGRSELQPGNLIFWQNLSCPGCSRWNEVHHTGIYIGDGKVIEASSGKGRVIIRDLWSSASYPIFMFGRPY